MYQKVGNISQRLCPITSMEAAILEKAEAKGFKVVRI